MKNYIFLCILFLTFVVANAAITSDLKSGSKGAEVKELQTILKAKGYLKATPNGVYGPATTAAVKAFQKANKISQTGTVGPSTRAALNKNNASTTAQLLYKQKIKDYTTSIWLPYWKEKSGVDVAAPNMDKWDILSPFSFEMQLTGTIKDPLKLDEGPIAQLIKDAKAKNKLIIPSVLWWPNGADSQKDQTQVLNDSDLRGAVVYDMMQLIKKYDLDGLDIDFEGKAADAKSGFTTFLNELNVELKKQNKLLVCTIEARTPIYDKNISQKAKQEIEYSNDWEAIGKVCDQVRIMTYDQMTDDATLNQKRGQGYMPVSDIAWVQKVITDAMRVIEWRKIIIGVPTYGYKFEVIRDSSGAITSYKRIGSMNWSYANEESKTKNITPTRNDAGELSYTYKEYKDGKEREYLVWYSDAKAIADKINIAKLYKVGGIAIFKIDGNNDPAIWDELSK